MLETPSTLIIDYIKLPSNIRTAMDEDVITSNDCYVVCPVYFPSEHFSVEEFRAEGLEENTDVLPEHVQLYDLLIAQGLNPCEYDLVLFEVSW